MPSNDDVAFKVWYAEQARKYGLNPNPDDPRHFYDYRSAWRAGSKPDESGHWPSQFKIEGHPRMVLEGVNTKTGEAEMGTNDRYKVQTEIMPIDWRRKAEEISKATGQPVEAILEEARRIGALGDVPELPGEKRSPSLMGQDYTPAQEGGQTYPTPMPREDFAPAQEGGQTAPTGTTPKGGGGWTDAATLAMANSLPALISAAYQKEGPPAGRSVGGGKPAFQMPDPFGKREKFRSMMAQYLR